MEHSSPNAHAIRYTNRLARAWQIQSIDVLQKKKIYIYKQKINRCKVIVPTVN